MSLLSFLMCKMFTNSDEKRDAGLSTPSDVARYDDLLYGPDGKWQRLDVYRPEGFSGRLPVIVSVHGGGWVYGDKERYQFYCMDLARRGFAVVNFSYHLAPRFKFPQQLLDTTLAFQWVWDNAETYGLDTSNLFAVGDSAGGHLLALYCVLCTVPEYAAQFSLFAGSKALLPSAVALNCGVYEVTNGSRMNNILMKDLLPRRAVAEDLHRVSPLLYLTSSFPPAFIATAVKDFLCEDSLQLHDRLTALGVPNLYCLYDNEDHTLGHVFHLNIRSDMAKECNDEECSFFREHLSKPDA